MIESDCMNGREDTLHTEAGKQGGSESKILQVLPQEIEGEDLLRLVPHRGKMFLLSRVTAHDIQNRMIRTESEVREDCIFYEEELGGIPVWTGFEFMAQSIAALTSIRHLSLGLPPAPPGVILSVSNFSAKTAALPLGSCVQTTVKEDYQADQLSRFDCELSLRGEAEALATGTLTVMSIGDMHSFFKR